MTKRPRAIAAAGAFVAALSTSLVAVSTPVIARDLSCTPADASWILTAYLLAVSAMLALAGKAADVLGRNRVYFTGFVFFIAGGMMCAAAPALRPLIGARVLQGVGAAMLMAVGPAIVTRTTAPEHRARALGAQLAATYLGLTLGPSLGGLLAAKMGWHAVFVVVAGAAAIGLVLAIALLPDDDEKTGAGIEALDLPGALLFALALTTLLFALKRVGDGWSGLPVLAIGSFSLACFAAFRRHAALHPSPLLPLELFKQAPFAFGVIGATLLYTVTFMLAYLLPFHLQNASGLSPSQAGAYMTAQPAAMAIVAPMSGVIADRHGPRVPCVAGMILIAVGLVLVGMMATPPGPSLCIALAIVGCGAGLYVAPNSAVVMGAAPRNRQGAAGAVTATARNVGMTLGVALAASLDTAVGFRTSLLIAAGLAAGGALFSFVRAAGVDSN